MGPTEVARYRISHAPPRSGSALGVIVSQERELVRLAAPRQFEDVHDLQCLSLEGASIGLKSRIFLDLSNVRFMKPPAIVGVLVFIEHLLQQYRQQGAAVAFPKDGRVLDYLGKIGFRSALECLSADFKWPSENFLTKGSPAVRPMVPARRFSSSDDIETIANWMASIFQTELMGLGTLLKPCHIIFSELADNTLFHAESGGGFVLAQEYWPEEGERIIELAVGDCGIGIRRALMKNEEIRSRLPSDEAAIRLALADGVTSLQDKYRGYGLGEASREVRAGRGRVLTIRSGAGWARVYDDGSVQSGEYKVHGTPQPICGTIIHAVIPAGRN